MSLLDCGCGSGSITVGLAAAVDPGRVIGVDVSKAEIERARARAAEMGIANLEFVVGDIYRLDSADDAFDAIFSHNVLEHLQEPVEALREMCRVLKPGGVIGIRDIDWGGVLIWPPDPALKLWLDVYEADWAANAGDPRIGRRLRDLLGQAGFTVPNPAPHEVYPNRERLAPSAGSYESVTEPDSWRE
jgi:ubiquinone/menaquinone biosynthesis C-methylase UbiE